MNMNNFLLLSITGAGWGSVMRMASYNKFHHNALRDALIVPLVNCFTSFFAGFAIFAIIGFMAHESGLPISEIIKSGPSLAFIGTVGRRGGVDYIISELFK